MTISAADLFPDNFVNDFFHITKHLDTEFVYPGGRGSCKSSFISLVIAFLIDTHPELNAVIVRKVGETLKDSVYGQMLWALEKLHIIDKYSVTKSPLRITKKKTGQEILFRGADKPEKIKSIKLKNGYPGILWLEEVTEFTPKDVDTIELSVLRGGPTFYEFLSYNPPASARNWCNSELTKPKPGRFIHFTDYRTVPPEWLGPKFLADAEYMKEHNPRGYDNVFLGIATGSGLNVFNNLEIRPITAEEINGFEFFYNGIDWGYSPDPLRYVRCSYIRKTRTLYIFGECDCRKARNEESFEIVAEYMESIGGNIYEEKTVADSSEPKSIADYRAYGGNVHGANKGKLASGKNAGKTSRNASFKWLEGLTKIIVDPIRCPKTADELANYEHEIDKKTGEILAGYPDGQPDHGIDAVRYSTEEIWRKAGA